MPDLCYAWTHNPPFLCIMNNTWYIEGKSLHQTLIISSLKEILEICETFVHWRSVVQSFILYWWGHYTGYTKLGACVSEDCQTSSQKQNNCWGNNLEPAVSLISIVLQHVNLYWIGLINHTTSVAWCRAFLHIFIFFLDMFIFFLHIHQIHSQALIPPPLF